MISETNNEKRPNYLNPYFGGLLLGLLLLAVFFLAGRGLSATGGLKLSIATILDFISHDYAANNPYWSRFIPEDGGSPMFNWLVFAGIGTFFGGLISGIIYGRLGKLRVEHSPKISSKTRLVVAGIGGILFGMGSQFGRGCSSGAALSGTGAFSFGGLLILLLMFGTGYAVAYFFRKLWI